MNLEQLIEYLKSLVDDGRFLSDITVITVNPVNIASKNSEHIKSTFYYDFVSDKDYEKCIQIMVE